MCLNAQFCSVNVREKFSWYLKYVVSVFTLRDVSVNIHSIWIHNVTENIVSLGVLDDDVHSSCSLFVFNLFCFNTTKYLTTLHFCLVAKDCIIFTKGFSLLKTFCSLKGYFESACQRCKLYHLIKWSDLSEEKDNFVFPKFLSVCLNNLNPSKA